MKHGIIRPSLLSLLALAAPLSCVFVGSYLPGGSRGSTVQRHAQALPPIPPLPPLTGAAGRGKGGGLPEMPPLPEMAAPKSPSMPELPPLPSSSGNMYKGADARPLAELPPLPPLPGVSDTRGAKALLPLPPLPRLPTRSSPGSADGGLGPLPQLPPWPTRSSPSSAAGGLAPLPPLPTMPSVAGTKAALPPLPPLPHRPSGETPYLWPLPGFNQLRDDRRTLQRGQAPPTPAYMLKALVGPAALLRRDAMEDVSVHEALYARAAGQHLTTARPLNWEEARMEFVPTGQVILGVVEEIRPYGAFVGLVAKNRDSKTIGEDSRLRGFCQSGDFGPAAGSLEVGMQVGVKIQSLDHRSQRIFVSVEEVAAFGYDDQDKEAVSQLPCEQDRAKRCRGRNALQKVLMGLCLLSRA
eukprot:CAMPEP_0203876176 /NCGR_PEP_ID=MMETSP0359-20131031/21202_1 /ASSEMBLY_ACC=CAM_ASM_000338 /TAXON_ID=268821 /ORGANISM="Scrippsiella Hangoei, Strain SHTV-5" /LENGTH=410 /DNA_ID=CAMNT_0050795011 /DNA_START=104 /DNA_END=1332 /DNA_ORIENTATION=+